MSEIDPLNRPPLTTEQIAQIDAEVSHFVRLRNLDGLHCIVILDGRQYATLAYHAASKGAVLTLLASSYKSEAAELKNDSRTN